jgi:hypothetical protein
MVEFQAPMLSLTSPFRFAWFCEIPPAILSFAVEGFEVEKSQTRCSSHSVPLRDRNIAPGLMMMVQRTIKVRSQCVVRMMEEFCQLLCGYFLD